jgi:hypothetical protein
VHAEDRDGGAADLVHARVRRHRLAAVERLLEAAGGLHAAQPRRGTIHC